MEVGETYTVKATVKEWQEYKGQQQTVLNRVSQYVEKPKKSRKKKGAINGNG